MRCRGGLGYHKRSNVVRGWFRCLRREEAEGSRQPEMGLPLVKKTVEVVLRPGRSGGPSLEVLALSVALVPSRRRLSGSPRRGCNLDPGNCCSKTYCWRTSTGVGVVLKVSAEFRRFNTYVLPVLFSKLFCISSSGSRYQTTPTMSYSISEVSLYQYSRGDHTRHV